MDKRRMSWGSAATLLLSLVMLLMLALGLSACSSDPPPDTLLSRLGSTVGARQQNEVDFPALMRTYTTQAYAEQEEAFAKYKLYLAAKAADLALNQVEPDLVTFEKDVSDEQATVTLTMDRKSGIFAVANAGVIIVSLQKVDEGENPWRIEWIDLSP